MSSQIKFPFSVNLLTDRLNKEVKDLAIWNGVFENRNNTWTEYAVRQAKGNIPSTENRIKELKDALAFLNPSS